MARPDCGRNRASQGARHCRRARADATFRREGRGHERLFPRPRWFADGIYGVRRRQMREAPGTHNPNILPPDIPIPQDDGAANHLTGMQLPDLTLPATTGAPVNLSKVAG